MATLLFAAPLAQAAIVPRFFAGFGLAAESPAGFEGGFGYTAGLALPVSTNADIVLRADGNVLPGPRLTSEASSGPAPFGVWPPYATRTNYSAALVGVRLRPDEGLLRPQLEGLAGIGILRDPFGVIDADAETHTRTSLATSIGGGFQFMLGPIGLFADLHFDYYFFRGVGNPIIPIRLGLSAPLQPSRHSTGPRDV